MANSESCDRCGKACECDFCRDCGKDLCRRCADDGCCGRVPARSGVLWANHAYRMFGNNPPEMALRMEISGWAGQ